MHALQQCIAQEWPTEWLIQCMLFYAVSTAMLCSYSAKDNLQCKLTGVMRRQPCSVAMVSMLCSNGSNALALQNSKKPPSASLLCSSSAKDNLQCTRTAVIRGQPYSVAVVPKLSHSNKERTFKRKHCLRNTDLSYQRTCS